MCMCVCILMIDPYSYIPISIHPTGEDLVPLPGKVGANVEPPQAPE